MKTYYESEVKPREKFNNSVNSFSYMVSCLIKVG